MRSNVTTIICDYEKNGVPCGKTFTLPDPPALPTEGNENIVSITIILDGVPTILYFCCRLHAIAYLIAVEKAETSAVPKPEKLLSTKLGFSETQFKTLQEMGIIVSAPTESRAHEAVAELETLPRNIPPAPENLRLP